MMLDHPVMKRLKDRFAKREEDMNDWEVPTEIYETKGVNTEINTVLVTPDTVLM
jgi:hypothetical protein